MAIEALLLSTQNMLTGCAESKGEQLGAQEIARWTRSRTANAASSATTFVHYLVH